MRGAAACLAILLIGCEQQATRPRVEIQTVDDAPMRRIQTEPPPQLAEAGTATPTPMATPTPQPPQRRPTGSPTASPSPSVAPAALTNLPFVPAIAMDPVDGSKIPIGLETPYLELKNRIYYFSSDANRRAFMADPDRYLKGQLTRF
jgi:YHS domain-containing protein